MKKISFVKFGSSVNDFYDYLQRKIKPTPAIMDLWYQKIKNFTESEVYEAFEYMKDNLDAMPQNLPRAIKKAVFLLNKAKPQRDNGVISRGRCDGCGGIGLFKLRVSTPDGKSWHEPIQYCSQCDNYLNFTNDPRERISKAELEDLGNRFKPYNKVFKNSPNTISGPVTQEEFTHLAKTINKKMNISPKSRRVLNAT